MFNCLVRLLETKIAELVLTYKGWPSKYAPIFHVLVNLRCVGFNGVNRFVLLGNHYAHLRAQLIGVNLVTPKERNQMGAW